MTGRAAALQGGLAALGLIAAHLTWQRDPDLAPGDVIVIDASKSDVQRVHYEDDSSQVDLSRQAGESYVLLHVVERAKPPAVAPPGKPPIPPIPLAPPRDLRGGDGATSLMEKFGPLSSPRGFGVLDAAKLKELGFQPGKRTLAVTLKGDTRTFEIGQPGASAAEAFIQDMKDHRVFLLPRGLAGELQNAAHMVDRKLHTFEMADYDRLVVTAGGKTRELVHLGKEQFNSEGFASVKTPDKRDQMAKNWHDNLWRAFPMELLGRGETPPEGAPQVVARVAYHDRKSQVGWLELARGAGASKTSTEDTGPTGDIYARTEHTIGWVKLHSGTQLVSDAEKIASAN